MTMSAVKNLVGPAVIPLSQLPALVWSTDEALRINFVGGSLSEDLVDPSPKKREVFDLFQPLDPGILPMAAHAKALAGERANFNATWQGRYLAASVEPLRDLNKRVVGVAGVAIDMSHRRDAEKDLRNCIKELERSNRELEEFAYVVSHDLKAPIRGIQIQLRLLQEQSQATLDFDGERVIRQVIENTSRMASIIDSLLYYSKMGASCQPMEVDCNTLLKEVLKSLDWVIQDEGAVITSDPLPSIYGEWTPLSQVFQNLFVNALKFRGQNSPRIHLSASSSEAEYIFSVRDNGVGIAPERLPNLFDLFHQLRAPRRPTHQGLGLAICKKIIDRHKGRIWATSEEGKGSIFHFSLPR